MKHHGDEVSGRSFASTDQVSGDTLGHIIRNPVFGFVHISFYQVVP